MVNMTPDFYNFFRNALEMLGLEPLGLKTFCVFIVDVASVGRFPIDTSQSLFGKGHDSIKLITKLPLQRILGCFQLGITQLAI